MSSSFEFHHRPEGRCLLSVFIGKEKGCWEKANIASTTKTEETYLYHYGSDEKETCEFTLKKNGFFGDCPQLNSYL